MVDFSCQPESPAGPAVDAAGLFETVNQEKTMLTLEQKHSAVDAACKRWLKRLTRASNELRKLERQRRRLEAQIKTGLVVQDMAKPKPVPVEVRAMVAEAIGYPPVETEIPSFLDRRDPVVAEQMTKARKASEAKERSKMPLTGKAAIDFIKNGKKKK
jgi:hypothetical protein